MSVLHLTQKQCITRGNSIKKLLLGIASCTLLLSANAQEKLPFVDLDRIWMDAGAYENDGNHEKALEELSKIPKNDSIYFAALTSVAYHQLSMQDFDGALATCAEGLAAEYDFYDSYFHINKVAALLGKKDYEGALQAADEAILQFPKHFKLHYNRGMILYEMERLDEAAQAYQTSIYCNPFYASSHLKLGVICYRQHLISQTMMCFNTYLLLNPDGDDSFGILQAEDGIVKSKNDSEKIEGMQISPDDEYFEEIDVIINNYVALGKKYKVSNKIQIPLMKQNHAMMSKLSGFEGNGGFWDQFYVPLHRYIMDNGHFDAFIYTICFSIENEKYKSIVDKQLPAIRSFLQTIRPQILDILGATELEKEGKKTQVGRGYVDGKLKAQGELKDGKAVGLWEIYNDYGICIARGAFDENEEKTGEWSLFDEQGRVKEVGTYVAGKSEGPLRLYHDNGMLSVETTMKNGEIHGEYRKYNRYGAQIEFYTYVDGKYEGDGFTYYPTGNKYVNYKIPYTDNKANGKVLHYYANGTLMEEISYKNDLKDGEALAYYITGQLYSKEMYTAGKQTGERIEYFPDGTIREKGQYTDGEPSGTWQYFFHGGVLKQEVNYVKGKLEGQFRENRHDGKPLVEYVYKKGDIIAYTFFDADGKVLKSAQKQAGKFFYEGHAENGNITAEGLYDVDGGKIGTWKYYTHNHVLTSVEQFTDDSKLDGIEFFHPNGELSLRKPYKEDSLNGYCERYFPHKQMAQQGWYKNNMLQGTWLDYYQDGTLKSNTYYTNDKLYGTAEFYAPDGKLSYEYVYYDDDLKKERYFTPDGTLYEEIDLELDSSVHVLKNLYSNGKTDNSFTMLYNVKNGPFQGGFYSGKKAAEGTYLNNERHGKWTWYYESGKVRQTAEYLLGERVGTWKWYFENGKIESETTYDLDEIHGKNKDYNEQGILVRTTDYEHGEMHGRYDFYSEEGKLQLTRYYDHGILIGWGYQDNTGKDIPMIPITNETAEIKAYFANGKVSRIMQIVQGKFQGPYKEYYATGQLYEEQEYKDDEREGALRNFYPDGKLKKEEFYTHGERNGTSTSYFPNGQIEEVTEYRNNLRHGTYKKYNSSGKLIVEQVYFDDEVFSETHY